jgi:uncharacterized membrane protein
MDPLFTSLLFGTLGGLVRALVGIAKYVERNRSERKLRPLYLVVSLVVAAIVGGLAGALVAADWRFAVIAGYAGADFLEGLYKIRMKQGLEI